MIRHLYTYLTLAAVFVGAISAAEPKRPNVLVIMSDDQGYADVGVNGCKDVKTPHLDALARSGVRCTDAYVTAPVCSPSRAGMLAGRYQQRFGHYYNTGGPTGLPVSVVTIADRMKSLGYKTAAFGKWHLGTAPQFHPNKRGFDHFFGIPGGQSKYFDAKLNLNGEKVEEKDYLTDAFGRETAAFIAANKDTPFFIYCAFNAVHAPLHAKEADLKRYADAATPKRQKYAAMLTCMDENVGRIVASLRDNQLLDNTLVIFLSDNGGPTPYTSADNGILRGGKGMTWEGGVRVPFFVSWPGKIPAGGAYDGIVSSLDVAPTAIAAAGGAIQKEWALDGINLLPQLADGQAAVERAVFWRWHEQWGIRQGSWKLVQMKNEEKPTLYRLDTDVSETTDLSAQFPEKLQALTDAYTTWNAANVDPLWGRFGKALDE